MQSLSFVSVVLQQDAIFVLLVIASLFFRPETFQNFLLVWC